MILTAARAGEVVGMTWDEIDLGKREWTVPANRMKAHRPHQVPLSDAAVALLEQQAAVRHSPFVFPGRVGRLSVSALLDIVQPRGVTVHGFRSSFRDWCAEKTNTPREICEMALAHKVGSAVERAYATQHVVREAARADGGLGPLLYRNWGCFCRAPTSFRIRRKAA